MGIRGFFEVSTMHVNVHFFRGSIGYTSALDELCFCPVAEIYALGVRLSYDQD